MTVEQAQRCTQSSLPSSCLNYVDLIEGKLPHERKRKTEKNHNKINKMEHEPFCCLKLYLKSKEFLHSDVWRVECPILSRGTD